MSTTVRYQHVRNATGLLEYGGQRVLIDPMLAAKDAYPGFEGTLHAEVRIPTVELPVPAAQLIAEADVVLATHLHADHWDDAATALVPKDKPVLVQNDADAATLRAAGFSAVSVVPDGDGAGRLGVARFTKTPCQHGTDELYAIAPIAERMGSVSGYFFHGIEGAKTVMFTSDTIWYPGVEAALKKYQPDVVVMNGGDAQMLGGLGSIIMGKEDVARVHAAVPQATIVVVHLEAVNHCVVTRKELHEFVAEKGLADFVRIPEDGEVIVL